MRYIRVWFHTKHALCERICDVQIEKEEKLFAEVDSEFFRPLVLGALQAPTTKAEFLLAFIAPVILFLLFLSILCDRQLLR